jgi:hypothetical protein
LISSSIGADTFPQVPQRKRSRSFLRAAAVAASMTVGACTTSPETAVMTNTGIAKDIPCDANYVLKSVCQNCHSGPLLKNGAPFPLVVYADTQSVMAGNPMWYYMAQFVRDGGMPLPPVQITQLQRTALLAWLDMGAPPRAAGDTCSDLSGDAGDQDPEGGPSSEDGQDPGSANDDAGAMDDSDAPADDGSAAPQADADSGSGGGDAEAGDTDSGGGGLDPALGD